MQIDENSIMAVYEITLKYALIKQIFKKKHKTSVLASQTTAIETYTQFKHEKTY